MTEQEIKESNTVKLKSGGGNTLTVGEVSNKQAMVYWWYGGEIKQKRIPIHTLKKSE